MSIVAIVMGFIAIVVSVWSAFMLARIEAVYRVRQSMLNEPGWLRIYDRLPSYDEMLRPKYWLLWTVPHWKAWLARQEAA